MKAYIISTKIGVFIVFSVLIALCMTLSVSAYTFLVLAHDEEYVLDEIGNVSSDPYAFSVDEQTGWNSCYPIKWGVLSDDERLIFTSEQAIARIDDLTGFTFRKKGIFANETPEVFADIVISYKNEQEFDFGNTYAKTDISWGVNSSKETKQINKAIITINTSVGLKYEIGRFSYYQVLLHELGHAMGLDHTSHSGSLMQTHLTDDLPVDFSEAERIALHLLATRSAYCLTPKFIAPKIYQPVASMCIPKEKNKEKVSDRFTVLVRWHLVGGRYKLHNNVFGLGDEVGSAVQTMYSVHTVNAVDLFHRQLGAGVFPELTIKREFLGFIGRPEKDSLENIPVFGKGKILLTCISD